MTLSSAIVLDGGLGSALESDGHCVEGHPLWSAKVLYERPLVIEQVHREFVEAGADVITTASYQANVQNLMQHLSISAEEATQVLMNSVRLARSASDRANKKVLVAGSVGPYGACLSDGSEYTGAYLDRLTYSQLKEWHKPRIAALVAAEVDLLAVETIPGEKEALSIVEVAREFPSTKFILSFACKDERRTVNGELFSEVAAAVVSAAASRSQLLAVGVNCVCPSVAAPLLRSVERRHVTVPLSVYPNSGEIWSEHRWLPNSHVGSVASYVSDYVTAGAVYIGGCCRVSPDAIREIRNKVDQLRI